MKKKLKRFMTSRVVIVFLLIAVQLFLIFWSAIVLASYYYVYNAAVAVLSLAFLVMFRTASFTWASHMPHIIPSIPTIVRIMIFSFQKGAAFRLPPQTILSLSRDRFRPPRSATAS